jgi:hypothetical protein
MGSMFRDRRSLVVLALALAALLAWTLWPIPVPQPPPRARTPSATTPAPATTTSRLAELSRGLEALLRRTTRLTILTLDAQHQPIPGVELAMRTGEGGVTDERGLLVLEGVPPSNDHNGPRVEGPWLLLEGSSQGFIEGLEQTRVLYLEPACPGVVRIVDEQQRPVRDVSLRVWGRGSSAKPVVDEESPHTDHQGEAYLPLRPCGEATFDLRNKELGYLPWLSAQVQGDEPVTLELPGLYEAVLAVVDRDAAPLNAQVEVSRGPEPERLGPGLFLLRSRRSFTTITASAAGYPTHQARLPLDGGEHRLTLGPGREVEVTVLCDERCPTTLTCSRNPCMDQGGQRHRCSCQQGEAYLSGDGALLDTVPAAVDELTLELREASAVVGRWTGTLPCHAWAEHSRRSPQACRADGRFELDGVQAGVNTISVQAGLDERGAVTLELEPGATVDIGEIGPGEIDVDGVIQADFPLEGAMLLCSPTARVSLEPDGGFLLESLPPEAEQLDLTLWAPRYGAFDRRFPLPPTGSLETWVISQADWDDTTPLREDWEPGPEDTGAPWPPEDTGTSMPDRGLPLFDDSGITDSGEAP